MVDGRYYINVTRRRYRWRNSLQPPSDLFKWNHRYVIFCRN